MISRTLSKLEAVAEELSEKFPNVETSILVLDCANLNSSAQEKLKSEISKLGDVGILVNNVGMSYPFPQYFHELNDQQVKDLIELNVNTTTWMTRFVLPAMIEKKKGAIMNIGSFAGLHPSPLLAEYSATKSYVEKLSHSLNTEYKSMGISVQCHVPFFIVSKLSKYRKPTMFVPSAETYAKRAVETIGLDPVVSPMFLHNLVSAILDLVPEFLVQWATMNFHLGIRKRAHKKLERLRKQQEQESKKGK